MDKRYIPWEAHLNAPCAIAPGHVIKTQEYPHTPIAFVAVTTGSLGSKPSEDWATLIAAAPEMLCALRQSLDHIDGDEGSNARLLHREIQAIITKAMVG